MQQPLYGSFTSLCDQGDIMFVKSDNEEEPHGFQPRRGARLAVDGESVSLNPDDPEDRYTVEVKVHNLSSAGFMAECAQPVLIGSYVTLDVPGIGAVQAQVRWQIGSQMGGMFLDPISLARCEWTAAKAKVA
jgi:hypothetical protein